MSELRNKALTKEITFKRVIFNFCDIDYELRQPTIAMRSCLLDESKDSSGKLNEFKLISLLAVNCIYEPNTDIKVFEATDASVLLEAAPGSFLDLCAHKLLDLVAINVDSKKKN